MTPLYLEMLMSKSADLLKDISLKGEYRGVAKTPTDSPIVILPLHNHSQSHSHTLVASNINGPEIFPSGRTWGMMVAGMC